MSVALPIPEPRADDDEDVHWALSTASALWARGESQEALKWLRRAAETASDVNRDMRALELFKAAADFTGRIQAAAAAASNAAPLPALGSPPPAMPTSHAPATTLMTPQMGAGGPPPLPGNASSGRATSDKAGSDKATPKVEHGGATISSQQARAAIPASEPPPPRSAPPPPPRGRGGSQAHIPAMPTTSFPSLGRSQLPAPTGVAIGEERIEPMAPTVLHPSQPATGQGARQGAPTGTADRPFVARAAATLVAGKGLDTKAAKTLASNLSYGNLQRSEQDQFRAAVSKAATITAAQAREIANAATRQMPGTSDRATQSGVGPPSMSEPAPATQLLPPQSAGRRSETESAAKGPETPVAPAASAQAKPGGAGVHGRGNRASDPRLQPAGPSSGPTSERSRTQAKRRATLRRQGPGAVKPEPVIRDGGRIPEARPTQRFEEEITIERDLSHIQGSGRSGGSDLDENTNVLTGQEVDVEVGEAQTPAGEHAANGAAAEDDAALEPVTSVHRAAPRGLAATVQPVAAAAGSGPAGLDRGVDSSTDPGAGGAAEGAPPVRLAGAALGAQGGLSAFRVALVSDVVTGVVEATLLAAGEPVPAGRIAAVVVATDAASSSALAELFSRSTSMRKGTRS